METGYLRSTAMGLRVKLPGTYTGGMQMDQYRQRMIVSGTMGDSGRGQPRTHQVNKLTRTVREPSFGAILGLSSWSQQGTPALETWQTLLTRTIVGGL